VSCPDAAIGMRRDNKSAGIINNSGMKRFSIG
jgi:hypothetical protein